MTVMMRLRQQGRKNKRMFRLVVTPKQLPRDGKYIESIGHYNPHEKDEGKDCVVNAERAVHWLQMGAQPSEKVIALLKRCCPEAREILIQKKVKKTEKK